MDGLAAGNGKAMLVHSPGIPLPVTLRDRLKDWLAWGLVAPIRWRACTLGRQPEGCHRVCFC